MNDINAGAQFRVEGEPAFPTAESTENDNSAESSTDQTNTDQNQSQEGEQNSGADNADKSGAQDGGEDKGFADHPRWKEREADWTKRFNDQEQRHVTEIANLRKEIEEKYGAKPKADEAEAAASAETSTEEPPSWFGGDKAQWGEYQKHVNGLISQAEERGAKRALSELDTRSSKEKQAVDAATQYFNDEVTAIESDKTLNPEGKKVDRNKLLKTALDNDLVDSQGRWNYKAAFRLMKPADVFQAKAVLDEKKKIADASTSESRAESKPDGVTSSLDFSKPGARPW